VCREVWYAFAGGNAECRYMEALRLLKKILMNLLT